MYLYMQRVYQTTTLRTKGGAMVRALASHQCGPGSNPSVDAICGLSLLLVLSFALRGFSPGSLVFPSLQNPTFPKSGRGRTTVWICYLQVVILLYLFIYLFKDYYTSKYLLLLTSLSHAINSLLTCYGNIMYQDAKWYEKRLQTMWNEE